MIALVALAIPLRPGSMPTTNAATNATAATGSGSGGKAAQRIAKAPAQRATTPSPAPTATRHTARSTRATPVEPPAGHGPSNSLRTTGSTAVALTFDDGPDPVQTPRMLALLARFHVKATFCLVGQNIRKYPEIVRQIAAAGHTLCNHTWNHSLTIGKDKPEQIRADLERTNAQIKAVVPGAQVPFFRAPGGNFTDPLVTVAASEGMTSLYWAVDPRDWDHPDTETDKAHIARVVAGVRAATRPGAIVLSHDFKQPDTVAAYEQLLPWLTTHFTIGIPRTSAPTTPSPTASTPPPSTAPTPTPTESAPALPANGTGTDRSRPDKS